jgi:hypothetical protein
LQLFCSLQNEHKFWTDFSFYSGGMKYKLSNLQSIFRNVVLNFLNLVFYLWTEKSWEKVRCKKVVWTKIWSGGKSSLVIDNFRCVQVRFHTKTMKKLVFFSKCPLMKGFRCVQVRFHTKTMKKLVFFSKCPLMTGFRCGQSSLWTGFTVLNLFSFHFHYVAIILHLWLMKF